jgi:beta propeller repeat protein
MSSPRSVARAALVATLCVVLLGLPAIAQASWFLADTRLQPSPGDQLYPDIDGTKIVYLDRRNVPADASPLNGDIYMYDLATNTERRLTGSPAYRESPSISGTRVVFTGIHNGAFAICLLDFATYPTTLRWITPGTTDSYSPDISGKKIVYVDERNADPQSGTVQADIYLFDLATNKERRLTKNVGNPSFPQISGTKVVWRETRNDQTDLYLYDLVTNTERRLTTDAAAPGIFSFSGSKIAFEDVRSPGGHEDLYLYDLNTNTERPLVTAAFGDQTNPAIFGNWVVYQSTRNGDEDLFLYDIYTGIDRPLTTYGYHQQYPAISGTTIVWEDGRNFIGETQVWNLYYTKPTYPTLTVKVPAVTEYGVSAEVTGTLLMGTHEPIGGKAVTLQYSKDGKTWQSYVATQTLPGGEFTLHSPVLTTARYLRVRFIEDADYHAAVSVSKRVAPKSYLTLTTALGTSSRVYRFRDFIYSGFLKPHHAARSYPVKLQFYRYEKVTGGTYRWVLRKTVSAKAYDYSTYTKFQSSVALPYKGAWRVRAYHPADVNNAATYSGWREFRVS